MQQSLRQRLSYGTIMLAVLLALLYFDYWVERTATSPASGF